MILLRALGIVPDHLKEEDVHIDDDSLVEIKPEIMDMAEAMLRGGVILSAMDWRLLTPIERACFIEAGNAIRDEQAIKTARMVFDTEFRDEVQSIYDGGEALRVGRKRKALMSLSEKMDEVGGKMASEVYVKP